MRVREAREVAIPEATTRPPVAPPRRSRVRSFASAMVGIPIIVLGAMVALVALDDAPAVVDGQRISVRTSHGGATTALVYGAGSGVHLVRVTAAGVPLAADLAAGDLHVASLRTLELDATQLNGIDMRLSATGHTLQLGSNRSGTGVRTGF